MQSNFAQCTPYFIKKNQIKIFDKFCIVFYFNNSALTIATHDITAVDDVTAAADDDIHIICTLLSHHNSSCYGIMTSHFKMSAKTRGSPGLKVEFQFSLSPAVNIVMHIHMHSDI